MLAVLHLSEGMSHKLCPNLAREVVSVYCSAALLLIFKECLFLKLIKVKKWRYLL